ncbi:MAG TPA: hypothetical protein DC058_24625 [Planctomycetaceae bacterium]|nr:hypothetical protein [Planctomycetaceae bacterium]
MALQDPPDSVLRLFKTLETQPWLFAGRNWMPSIGVHWRRSAIPIEYQQPPHPGPGIANPAVAVAL